MLKKLALLMVVSFFAHDAGAESRTGDPIRIDGSSVAKAEASYQAMMQNRSAAEQQKLAIAMAVLNMEGLSSAFDVVDNPALQSLSIGRVKNRVAGMSAEEIIALATSTSDVSIDVSE